jgi:hypothetical protein
MIITSNKRLYLKQMGIVLGNGQVVGEWGTTTIEASPKDSILFAYSHDDIWRLIVAERGRAKYWKKRYVAYEIDGRAIKSAKDIFSTLDPHEALGYLVLWRDWAWDNGAAVSSLTGTANSIWRGTLNDGSKIMVASGRLPAPTKELFLGGRQEVQRGVYESATLWDIRGAYPAAMGEIAVAAKYRRISIDRVVKNDHDVSFVGFARARVAVVKTFWGPLPKRTGKRTTFPIDDMVEGVYDFEELRVAHKIGLHIYITEAWIGRGVRFPWKKWASVIAEGRDLPSSAGRLVKASSNSLWGSFAINGEGRWVRYESGKQILEATKPPFKRRNSEILSAHIASHIRGRLFLESLYLNRDSVLAAHTDGCIFAPGAHPVPTASRDNLGNWQERKTFSDLVVIGPASYSYVNGNGERRYALPGTPPQHREKVFRHLLRGTVIEAASKLVIKVPFS